MQSSNDHENTDQDLKGEDKISWVEVKKFVEEKKIEQAECVFLRKPNSEVEIPSKERKNEDEKERLCSLHGLAISEHIRSRNAKNDDSPECETDWTTTKCYGQTYNSSSPFMRLWWKADDNSSTKPSVVFNLLTEKWKLKKPKLVVSVIGDIDSGVPKKLRQAFQEGIETLLKTQDTWLLTDGRDTGLAKLVGKAVERLDHKEKGSAVAIGVAHWGTTNVDQFRNEGEKSNSDRKTSDSWSSANECDNNKEKPVSDKQRTHFILIDDARYDQPKKAVAEFIAEFQNYICSLGKKATSVSLVCGGSQLLGPDGDASPILDKGIPVVMVKGSGGDDNTPRRAEGAENAEDTRKNKGGTKRTVKKLVCVLDGEPTDGEIKGLNAAVLKAAIE